MPLPSFLCIGAQKAGTSWLFVQMSKHPEVWMPLVKELHFFDHVYNEKNRSWTTGHIRSGVLKALRFHLGKQEKQDWSYIRYLADMADRRLFTDEWYERCFDRPKAEGKVCGDITPEYSTIPPEGIDHALRLLPGVKVIYIVRDPVERALSQLRMNVQRRGTVPDEHTLLRMCDESDIDNRGNYRSYIPRWQAKVSREKLLILPYGAIKADAPAVMRKIEDLIGVSHFDGYDFGSRVHETKKFDIPASVHAKFAERYVPQYEFLKERFGEDFVKLTK